VPPRRTGRTAKVAALDTFVVEFAHDDGRGLVESVTAPSAGDAAAIALRRWAKSGDAPTGAMVDVMSSRGRIERWYAPNAYRVEFYSCWRAGGV
jgi:hypothetical protein